MRLVIGGSGSFKVKRGTHTLIDPEFDEQRGRNGIHGHLAKMARPSHRRLATRLAARAAANLATHPRRATWRDHDLPDPRIRMEQGRLDYFVLLEAVGDGAGRIRRSGSGDAGTGGLNAGTWRAIGIEYGHRKQPQANESNPTGILSRAVGDIARGY